MLLHLCNLQMIHLLQLNTPLCVRRTFGPRPYRTLCSAIMQQDASESRDITKIARVSLLKNPLLYTNKQEDSTITM